MGKGNNSQKNDKKNKKPKQQRSQEAPKQAGGQELGCRRKIGPVTARSRRSNGCRGASRISKAGILAEVEARRTVDR